MDQGGARISSLAGDLFPNVPAESTASENGVVEPHFDNDAHAQGWKQTGRKRRPWWRFVVVNGAFKIK